MVEHELPADQHVPLEDQLAEMIALRDEGKIVGIGISTATLPQVKQAIAQADIVCVQNAYSLVDQTDADVLKLYHDSGIAYVPYFPLGSLSRTYPKSPTTRPGGQLPSGSARHRPRSVWRGSWPTATTSS